MLNLLGPQEGGIWPWWTSKGDRGKGNVKNNFPSAQLPLSKSGLISKDPALPKYKFLTKNDDFENWKGRSTDFQLNPFVLAVGP